MITINKGVFYRNVGGMRFLRHLVYLVASSAGVALKATIPVMPD